MSIEEQRLKTQVELVEITEAYDDQRLDNFLITRLKGVPKSRIYRIVRKGEVRVNKSRVDAKYRLCIGDIVRIPPIRMAEVEQPTVVSHHLQHKLDAAILYEDDGLIVLNKPAGFAVHGGSGMNGGIIEALRQLRPDAHFLELIHRLDKDTSGCLLIAKKRSALRQLHELFRKDRVQKTYLALLAGRWAKTKQTVNAPLQKNIRQSGERMVMISATGKEAETVFTRIKLYQAATLVEAAPKTGRTHQIRVHAKSLGHPIIGDERYGIEDVNKQFKSKGYHRMFLHAATLTFQHPVTGKSMTISAPLPEQLQQLLNNEAL